MTDIRYTFSHQGKARIGRASFEDTKDRNKPIVVMVHGQGGNLGDWIQPGYHKINFDYEGPGPAVQNHGWHLGPPLPMTFPPVLPMADRRKSVVGIQPYLKQRGFPTVVYTQHQSDRVSIQQSALELEALVGAVVQATGGPASPRPIALLAHSRGGLVVRAFLKDNGGTDLTRRISRVITLISPHQGSQLANLSVAAGVPIEVLVSGLSTVSSLTSLIRSILKPFADWLSNDSRKDLQVGSQFLQRLAHGEAPLPGVRYVTFGGTSTTVTRIWQHVYTPDSYVPRRMHLKSFNHRSFAVQWPMISPLAETIPAPCDELRHGRGDLLVSNERSKLPFSLHRTMHVNHAEVLWDDRTKVEIADLLS
ncbi:MAG: hypothetical protein HRU70_01060 [Phycisphaeraceae bacterium]|nr:MAG: hypothetical protein HRU70_01060 [Phycisphaeraceae bacterium]